MKKKPYYFFLGIIAICFVFACCNAASENTGESEENMGLLIKKHEAMLDDISLDGIGYAPEGKSVAIIEGKIKHVGDSVMGFRIKEIEPDKVIMTRDGLDYSMRVKVAKADKKRSRSTLSAESLDNPLYVCFESLKEKMLDMSERIKEIVSEKTSGKKEALEKSLDNDIATRGGVPEAALQGSGGDGTFIGHIYVWGRDSGDLGGTEGIIVRFRRKYGHERYKSKVDARHQYTLVAPAGTYLLEINKKPYRKIKQEVIIKEGEVTVNDPIKLQKE